MLRSNYELALMNKSIFIVTISSLFSSGISGRKDAVCVREGRREHLDACRGLAILLVVYSHIILRSVGFGSELNTYFMLFRMPLFMFISGYLAFTVNMDFSRGVSRSVGRIVRQLYPTLVFWCAYLFMVYGVKVHITPVWEWEVINIHKRGYWFTFVLVELFFLSLPMLYAFNRYALSRKIRVSSLVVMMMLIIAAEFLLEPLMKGSEVVAYVSKLLSIPMLLRYAFFFFLGMVVKNYDNWFERLCNHWITFLTGAVLFLALAVWGNPGTSLLSVDMVCCGMGGVVAIYTLFKKVSQMHNGLLRRLILGLKYLGTRTLEIYLLHYIFLFVFRAGLRLPVFRMVANTWMEFPFVFGVSIAGAVMILLFCRVLKMMRVYRFLFPDKETVIRLTEYLSFRRRVTA